MPATLRFVRLNIAIQELAKTHLPVGSLRARMAKGTFWTLIGSVTAQGAGLLGSIFCARILGKVGFGELGMIRSTVLMFGVLAGTGLGMATTKYVAEFRVKDPHKAGRMIGLFMNTAIILGGSVTLVCLIIAAPLAKWAMNAPHLAGALQVGCLLLLLNPLNGVQLGAVCGFEAFRAQSRVIVLDGIFNLALIPAGAFVYGVAGAVGGSVMAALLGFIVKKWTMHKECKRASIKVLHRNVSAELPALWKFVLPSIIVGVVVLPFDWLARIILVNGPNGYVEMGLFTAAFTWSQLILFLPGQIAAPTQPIIANLVGLNKIVQIRNIVFKGTFFIGAVAVGIGGLVVIFSRVIMLSYGEGYELAAITLCILTFSSIFCACSQTLKNFLYASNRVWQVVLAQLVLGIMLPIMAWQLKSYGANGLAIAYALGWFALLFFEVVFSAYRYRQIARNTGQI